MGGWKGEGGREKGGKEMKGEGGGEKVEIRADGKVEERRKRKGRRSA